MMASIVVNLSGILLCALQLFLWSNTILTSFPPNDDVGWDKASHQNKLWGHNELGFERHVLQPISRPRFESRSSLIWSEKQELGYVQSPQRIASRVIPETVEPYVAWPTTSESTSAAPFGTTTSPRSQRRPSYSLFPTEAELATPVQAQTPISTFLRPVHVTNDKEGEAMIGQAFTLEDIKSIYILNDLEPPPSLNKIIGRGKRQRRDSSVISSATVQIGLRLSRVPTQNAFLASPTMPLSSKQSSPLSYAQTQNIDTQSPTSHTAYAPRSQQQTKWAARDVCRKTLPPLPRQTPNSILKDDESPSSSPTTIIQPSPMEFSLDTPIETGDFHWPLLVAPTKVQLPASTGLKALVAKDADGQGFWTPGVSNAGWI